MNMIPQSMAGPGMAVAPPVVLQGANGVFIMRAYSKYDLRNRYGESRSTFRRYYLNDPETLTALERVGYKQRSKFLTRKMVEVIVAHHGVP